MLIAYYLTHPEVTIDPGTPVPEWRLSDTGRARAAALARRHVLPLRAPLFASTERKALELAEIIAAENGGMVRSDARFAEIDRSATGYLNQERFDAVVDAFFAAPAESTAGWERATDAQARVVAAVGEALERVREPSLFCGHGGVGTLLKCWLANRPIARSEDQKPGGGQIFAFDFHGRRLLSEWTAFEAFTA